MIDQSSTAPTSSSPGLMRAVARWAPPLLALALIAGAVARSSSASWLVGSLGLALLVKSSANAFDSENRYRWVANVAYLVIAIGGLLTYLALN